MEAPVIAAEVLEALETVLPEDAPAGHEAWQKVKFNVNHKWPHSAFRFGSQRFQATLGNCVTEQATMRLARACYVKFSGGDSKEQVNEFRDQIYAKIKGIQRNGDVPPEPPKKKRRIHVVANGADAPPAAGAEEGVGATASNSPPSGSPRAPTGSPPAPAGSPPAPGPAGFGDAAPVAAGAAEDAPEGHEAWGKICFEKTKGCVRLNLKTLNLPDMQRFQTTVMACGGSVDEACRVARLCYVRIAEGASRDEVTAFRKVMYDTFAMGKPGAPAGSPPAPRAARESAPGAARGEAATLEAAKRELKAQGRLGGSLLVEGRSLEKKNSSVNGLYARRAADYDGHGAYEKVGAEAAVRPRFLYYWREKSRWKIDNRIPSEKSGFAYLKVAGVASPANAGPDCQWHVCDDKGEGYNKDPDVRCVEVAPRPGANTTEAARAAPQASQDPAARRVEVAPRPEAAAKGAARAAPPASEDMSSSDDSSSDDAGDQTSGDEDESSSASGAEQPSQPEAAAKAAGRQANGAAPRGRACAKMLVRSGLRCVCHFRLVGACPGRPSKP